MNLTEIVEIQDKKIAFSRWWLFGEKLSLLIPDGMLAVSPREIGNLFGSLPDVQQPLVVLRNQEYMNISLYGFDEPFADEQVAGKLDTYCRLQSAASQLTKGMLNGRKGLQMGYFDFIETFAGQKFYSYYGIMPYKGKLFNIKCVAPDLPERYLEFRGIYRHMMKSISIERR